MNSNSQDQLGSQLYVSDSSVSRGASDDVAAKTMAPTDFLRVLQLCGRLLFDIDRQCWPDVWAGYDALYLALGKRMSWAHTQAAPSVDLKGNLSFLMRSIETPDFGRALYATERHFRHARFLYLLELHAQKVMLEVFAQRSDADAARLGDVVVMIRGERLAAAPREVVVDGRSWPVLLDTDLNRDDVAMTTVATDAPCPSCGIDSEWSYARTEAGIDQIVCECGYHLAVKEVE